MSSFISRRAKAQDSEAKQTRRTAARRCRSHMDHETYDATFADLENVGPSLRSARHLVVDGAGTTYDLAVDSASGRNT